MRRFLYYIKHPKELILDPYKEIKYFFQRGCRGYSDRDTWNIDLWFLSIMPKMLRHFEKNLHSYPSEFQEEESWHKILDHMIFCFKEANEDTCSFKNDINFDFDFKFHPDESGEYSTLEIVYPTKEDEEKAELHSQKTKERLDYMEKYKQEGLRLFTKYFNNLWD